MRRIVIILTGLLVALNSFAMDIEITVGGKTFAAQIEDSETGRAFCALLPMTLDMSELNGNEKYYYLSSSLPTDARYYGTLQAGDLMLFGSSCVVLFYGNAGGYSYTRLGRLTSTAGLADAVGSGDVRVTFSVKETAIHTVVEATALNDRIYDLDGHLLTEEPEKGVFIRNGNKIVK